MKPETYWDRDGMGHRIVLPDGVRADMRDRKPEILEAFDHLALASVTPSRSFLYRATRRWRRYALGSALAAWWLMVSAFATPAPEQTDEGSVRLAPFGILISVLSRTLQGGTQGGGGSGGGGGGSASALDAASTVVYSPEAMLSGLNCTLPTSYLDTRYDQGGVALTFVSDVTLTDTGNTATNHTNLQTEVTASLTRVGHSRIKLPDGWVSVGVLQCGIHTQGAYWTYIQRATRGTEGVRVAVADTTNAPILRVNTANRGAVETLASANRWRFDDIVIDSTASSTSQLVLAGPLNTSGDSTGSLVTDLPEYIYFSRCYFKGRSTGNIKNGLVLNCRAGAAVDCRIDQIFYVGVESHGIAMYNTYGPLKMVNNYIEAASIGVLAGGANPFTNCIPTDVEFRRNTSTLRDAWIPSHASYDGVTKGLKNRLELKCGNRWLIEGNVLEKSPQEAQNGEAIGIKCMAGESGLSAASWYFTKDICVRYNKARDIWRWFYCIGNQSPGLETLGGTSRVAFYHNLVTTYCKAGYGALDNTGYGGLLADVTDLAFVHMTCMPDTPVDHRPVYTMLMSTVSNGGLSGFILKDSLLHGGQYDSSTKWVLTNSGSDGEAELSRASGASYTLQKCIIANVTASNIFPSGQVTKVANIAAFNFTGDDPTAGLDSDSPAKNAATDGTDIGCDYTKVNLATSGVA